MKNRLYTFQINIHKVPWLFVYLMTKVSYAVTQFLFAWSKMQYAKSDGYTVSRKNIFWSGSKTSKTSLIFHDFYLQWNVWCFQAWKVLVPRLFSVLEYKDNLSIYIDIHAWKKYIICTCAKGVCMVVNLILLTQTSYQKLCNKAPYTLADDTGLTTACVESNFAALWDNCSVK